MNNKYYLIITLFFCHMAMLAAGSNAEQAYQTLAEMGFENIRVNEEGDILYVALEDNIYRGNYRGAAKALQTLAKAEDTHQRIVLTLLENQQPQVTLTAQQAAGRWSVKGDYPDRKAWKHLAGSRRTQSSFGKVDFNITPIIELDSLMHDNGMQYAIDLAPSIEMQLWRGAKLSAQVIVPLIHKIDYDEHIYKHIRPGTMTLSQQLISNHAFDATLTGGIFYIYKTSESENQYGVDLQANYHLNTRLTLGVQSGYTGNWRTVGSSWKFDELEHFSILGKVNYYEPRINTQLVLSGGRFVYGDNGVRLDAVRRLAEYAVGAYGTLSGEGGNSYGIYCSIPLGPKKKMKRYPVRINLAESMHFEHSIPIEGKEFSRNHRGVTYSTLAEGNYSSNYWQPAYVAKYVEKLLNAELK